MRNWLTALKLLILTLALPQLAAAANWEVQDTVSDQVVFPGGTVSVMEDRAAPQFAQRVYRIWNDNNFNQQLGPCQVLGDPSFEISVYPYPAGQTSVSVFPGFPTSITIQHLSLAVGTQEATVFCSGAGSFSFRVRARVLDPNPYIVLETPSGKGVPRNSTFNLGSVQAGVAADQDFRITNLGNQPLSTSLSLSGAGYSVVVPPPASIAKGASATFRLRLLAAASGTAGGQLQIHNNDPNDNPYTVFLTATVGAGPSPQIRITDNGNGGATVAKGSTVNLGSAAANAVLSRSFTITNTGSSTLTLGNPSSFLSGSGWSVTSFPSGSLAGGGSTGFSVRFQAGSPGSYPGTVSFTSNDLDDNPFSFNLLGAVSSGPAPRLRIVETSTSDTIGAGSYVSFGSPPAGTATTRKFFLYNDGNATLNLGSPAVVVAGAGFSQTGGLSSSLGAGGRTEFTLRFQGNAAGLHSGSATISHNDPSVASPLSFNLEAVVPRPVVTLTAADAEVSESAPNGGQLLLSRSGGTAAPLTVILNRSGTATEGADYTAIAPSQTFAVGQSTLAVPVAPVDDSLLEGVETLVLSLAADPAYTVGSPGSATLEITDNDFTPCLPGPARLCLQNGRFEATLQASVGGTLYTGQAVSLSDLSGGFWLFSADNLEVGVKVLDGSSQNGRFWTFHGPGTDLPYTLTVADRANPSRTRVYTKPAGSFCGQDDTTASFLKSLSAPALEFADGVEEVHLSAFTCAADATTVCLLGSRFQVRVRLGSAYQPVVQVTDQAAHSWFYSADNLELFVKVLDGTPVNGRHWVFVGSLTGQAYTLEVTDTATGIQKSYASPGTLCGLGDTMAF